MASAAAYRPSRADLGHAGCVAGVLFAVYALSAPRSVAWEDDGLFILSSYFLGIEHPPGYPLFTLVGHLFAQLPLGPVAYRVHLASALFGALTGAAAWLCARALTGERMPAYLAGLALGLSPVFWSQAIIAEVYTMNTLFFLVLVYLGLVACPPHADAPPPRRVLEWMALVFGLSLSNHYPLMLLAAPAFAILLWPLRRELLRRLGRLVLLVMLGLLPYVWLVYRSRTALPVSFYGPLETLSDVWLFVSRAGYAGVDDSASAGWLDRLKFFRFLGGQLVLQFAVLGTALAAAGFAAQWRQLGRRTAAFLTVAFLMPSAVLLLLLNFDYSTVAKHVFHVYPLPAYAVMALWLAIGLAWLVERHGLGARAAHAVAALVLLLILAVGARNNVFTDHDWAARYGRTLLGLVPAKAMVLTRDEGDLGPLGYLHMVENVRPDITLYNTSGLVLGNRLFDPLRTPEQARERIVVEAIARQTGPVVSTLDTYVVFGRRQRWLYTEIDKSRRDGRTVDIPEEAVRFLEESVLANPHANGFIAYFQADLRRKYARLLASSAPRARPPGSRAARHLQALANDYYGALGIAEGMLQHPDGYAVGEVATVLERTRELMPDDVPKHDLARFFYVRALLRIEVRDEQGAIRDLEFAMATWPAANNPAMRPLADLYRSSGDAAAASRLQQRYTHSSKR